ncbi:MAG: hypothetical protein ACRDRR_00130 [Pseudonocardiaceae bacterium]
MRFQSVDAADRIFAVCGLNTISFGIVAGEATKAGLLGFAVERIDRADDEDFFMVHDHHSPAPQTPSLFLSETADWQAKYTTGTFRAKRLKLYADMTGFSTL